MTRKSASARARDPWIAAAIVFALALAVRFSLPYRPHVEGDERIYRALVEQIEAGRGYTLQGHPILLEPGTDVDQYGQKLFFHPPLGIALFWAGHQIAGDRGFILVELLSFALFYAAVVWLASLVVEPFGALEGTIAALLAGFSPIALHVTSRWWLDGPILAFATLSAALAVASVKRRSVALAWAGGLALGLASLVKATAILVVPGVALLVLAVAAHGRARIPFAHAAVFLGVAALVFAPWLVWRWRVMGSATPGWAGRPAASLVATNPYVHYLTAIRGPWVYLKLLPEVHTTLVPSCLLMLRQWREARLRGTSLAFIGWIAVIVLVHVVLGYLGFSKVLRYVILASPAVIVLFTAQAGAAWRGLGKRAESTWVLLAIAAGGLVLEIVNGIHTIVIDRDLIRPWPWDL